MEASALRAPVGPARARPAGLRLRLRSDDQLVALFRLGHEEAFGAIHDRYRARLLAYAGQMLSGSPSDAEDALQDVFLRAYGALRADDRPVTLRAWLYRVAHNRCIDLLRRAAGAREVELDDDPGQLARTPQGADPAAVAERREQLRRLVCDVGRLPEQQRSALLMREMEGLSYAELADALQVTVGAVKSLLVRARMGLVEAQEARDSRCTDICAELLGAHDARRRPSAQARRHLRDCPSCGQYRSSLAGMARGLGSLSPSPGPWGLLAKLVGLGGVGTGGVAVGGSAAGGAAAGSGAASGAAVVGGSVATAKLAAVVCAAAIVGGGAVEAGRHAVSPRVAAAAGRPASRGVPHAPVPAGPTTLPARVAQRRSDDAPPAPARATAPPARAERRPAPTLVAAVVAPAEVTRPVQDAVTDATTTTSGGAVAPEEPEATAPDAPAADPVPGDPAVASPASPPTPTTTPATATQAVAAVAPVPERGAAPTDPGAHR